MRWKRLRRITLWTFAILLVLAAGLLVGLRFYLSSRAALPVVARGLQPILGGQVHVGGAHIGLVGDSTLHNVQAFEDSGSSQPPWLVLEDVEADLSAWDALRGHMPSHIDVSGGRIELHFDRNGKLLTHLPASKGGGPIPRLHLDKGQVVLVQQGRPPFVLKGISADVVARDQAIQLVGTVADPIWGEWSLVAEFVTGQKLEVHASTASCNVTMPMLTALPFVPAGVWKQVRIEGRTPVKADLTVGLGSEKPDVHYRVDLSPRDAHLEVPSIALQTEGTVGDVLIEDGKVHLRNVVGQYAEGSISTDADLDFTKRPDVLHFFNLRLKGIMLHDLPHEWKIPAGVDGRLSGDADLSVFIDKKVRTRGSGEGQLENPRLPLVHVKKPIKFYLFSDDRGFHFRHQLQRSQPTQAESAAESSAVGEVLADVQSDLQHLGSLPVRLTGQLMDGVGWMVREPPTKVRRSLHYFMAPPAPNKEGPTYLEVDVSLDDIKLEELITRLKLRLPVSISGIASVQAHAAIPINRPHDMKLYRFQGQATVPTLRVADVALTNLRGTVDYSDGVLKLEKVQGEVPGPQQAGKTRSVGRLQGSARVGLVPAGELSLNTRVERLPVDLLTVFLPGVKPRVTGGLTGTIDARVPLQKLGEAAAWQGTAALHAPELEIYGVSLTRPDAVLEVGRGAARLTRFTASFGGADLTGSARMDLAGKMAYEGEVHVDRINRALLDQLSRQAAVPMQVKGQVEASARVKGTLHPFVLSTEGLVRSGPVAISGVQLDSLRLRWSGDERQIKVPTLEARLYGGRVTGSAVVPVGDNQAGSADLRLDDIQLKSIAERMGGLPVRLEGVLSGTAQATITAASADRPRELSAKVELDSPELRVQGIPATRLRGDLGYRAGVASYRLEGNSLGGRITLRGKTQFPAPAAPPPGQAEPAEPPPRPSRPRSEGRLELRGIRLSRLWPYLRLQETLGPLSGTLSVVLPFELGPGARPTRMGRFELTGVRWEAEELVDLITGEVRLTRNALVVRNINAGLGEGSVRGRITYPLRRGGSGSFRLTLEQVDVRRLFLFYPALRTEILGVIDANLRGRIDQEWQGGGTLVLAHARIFGLDVAQWRVPVSFTLIPAEGSGQLTFSDSTADIARGRAQAQGRLSWGAGLDLRAALRFYEVDIGALLHNFGSIGSYAAGKVTGRADFSGDQMHSVDDLRATVEAHLRETQALALPVLRVLTPYLRPGISSATFQSGGLKGRLANGIFRVESLTLASQIIELVLVGTVTLSGRLDLDVSTRTGILVQNPNNLRTLGLRVRNVTALPLAVLTQAATLLANRVVHLHLTGTLRSPVIQILPATLLPEEAIRFFLLRAADASLP